MSFWTGRRVMVTGGRGFLGRRVVERIQAQGPAALAALSSSDYDLTRQDQVARAFDDQRPDTVIHLAARVGGIGANRDNPARYFYENAIMGIELMEQARRRGVAKFVQVGTVCSYPKFAPVPFREDSLWDGYPEETNAPYGLAKKMLLVQAQAARRQYGFNAIYLLPANLYGPGDNFDPSTSHVIPALIRKCVEAVAVGASSITAWGSGRPSREFLYVDDAARAIVMAAESYDDAEPVNIGTGEEVTISELVQKVARATGFSGNVDWDRGRPDGQPRRKLDVSRARRAFGFEAEVSLDEGLRQTVDWYVASLSPAPVLT